MGRDAPAVGAHSGVGGGVELEDRTGVPRVRVVHERIIANQAWVSEVGSESF